MKTLSKIQDLGLLLVFVIANFICKIVKMIIMKFNFHNVFREKVQ